MKAASRGGGKFKSTMALGRLAHKAFQKKFRTGEIPLGSAGRADGIVRGHIVELKPHNAKAIKKGLVQLQRYVNASGRPGQLWTYRRTWYGGFKFRPYNG